MLKRSFADIVRSVHFPGAINSKFTTTLKFERPSDKPAMPTYRVMDSDGVVVDEKRKPMDVRKEEVISWYENMLTGTHILTEARVDRRGLIISA